MSNVYRVGSYYETAYFNTGKEADRFKPGGEEPESFERLDAAEECNHLLSEVQEAERTINRLRTLLEELHDACSLEIHHTDIGRRVSKYIADNPLSPATCSERDGGRSYGV